MRPPARPPPGYLRRRPEESDLYRILQEHLETFLERVDAAGSGPGLPMFVARELRAFLSCGILAHGFARVTCARCRDDLLVAFSCKGRGMCPSCGGRRMADTAAHLVDRVLPRAPVRHWVLSLPFPLRRQLAWDPSLTTAVLTELIRAVRMTYRRLARARGIHDGRTGSVTAIQRAGSALDLNVHFHSLFIDGVFTATAPGQLPRFVPLHVETSDIQRTTARLARRVHRLLVARGLAGEAADLEPREAPPVPSAGPSRRDRIPGSRKLAPRAAQPLHTRIDGFDLQAATRFPRHRRPDLERLCRYLLRPPLAYDRVTLAPDGRVELTLPRPWRDGTWRLTVEPLAFIARLAALIPRPRVNTLRYHGVLAPAAAWRAAVTSTAEPPDGLPRPHLTRGHPSERPRRLPWADLLARTFGLELLVCATCGNPRRVLAMVHERTAITAILNHLGLDPTPPPVARARPPPDHELDLAQAA